MRKNILVVGDDEEVLEFVQAALEQEGYQVQANRTGAGFLPMPGRLPDLVLLDVLVQRAVGRAFAERWKLREPTTAMPLLLFSAHVTVSQVLPGSPLTLFSACPCSIRALLDAVGASLPSS
jgi:DNA-binding response OmpR family regulator